MLRILMRFILILVLLLWVAHAAIWARGPVYLTYTRGDRTMGVACVGGQTWVDYSHGVGGPAQGFELLGLEPGMRYIDSFGYDVWSISGYLARVYAPSWMVSVTLALPMIGHLTLGRWRKRRGECAGFEVVPRSQTPTE